MRKLCFFTSTRADYGILRPLLTAVQQSACAELALLVTGTHLRPEHGHTVKTIIADGFSVTETVDIFDGDDSAQATCDAMGRGISRFCAALERIRPDIFIILGDRFESLAAASAALITRTPVAHLHGGEATFGQYDESARHAITKLSHLHFTSTEAYRLRVIQMGEHPDRVFTTGSLGVENLLSTPVLARNELGTSLGTYLPKQLPEQMAMQLAAIVKSPYLVVMFHPVTLEPHNAEEQTRALLSAIADTKVLPAHTPAQAYSDPNSQPACPARNNGCNAIFIAPNADTGRNAISRLFDAFVHAAPHRYALIPSLPSDLFFNLLRHAEALVGNSSCGIIEAPSLPIATINIGERQAGRIQAASIINCEPEKNAIANALHRALSAGFRNSLTGCINPYEGDATAEQILRTLVSYPLDNLIKKQFYDTI